MISIKFISLFAVCTFADQSPWEGVNCGNEGSSTDVCQYGLIWVYETEDPKSSSRKCCLPESTFDNCMCMPCMASCSSTVSAQEQIKAQFISDLGYTDAKADAAAQTYICADSIHWITTIPESVDPVFKCCQNIDANHQCNCPPKDETKKCYSTWSNPDLYKCDFGESTSGEYCCRDSTGACKPDQGTVEGYTDWAGCWGADEDTCNTLASKTRVSPDNEDITQISGCVYDVSPIQKYCGLEVQSDTQCQDARPNFVDNNCGLGAVSDTEWIVNRRLSADGAEDLKFFAVQAIQGATGYCGTYWLPDSTMSTTAQPSEQDLLV